MKRNLFQLIDLDRTIFDTERFAKALTDEIEASEPGVGADLEARFEAAQERSPLSHRGLTVASQTAV